MAGQWRHPIHARGIRSPQLDATTGMLTDRKMDEYILQGRYGEERKKALIAERKAKKKKFFTFESALKMLLGK